MTRLNYTLTPVDALSSEERKRMFALFAQSYAATSWERFSEDLSWKQYAGVLRDEEGQIQGFTTIALNPHSFNADYDILYSGDTIISPEHWGSQELVRGFCRTAGRFLSARRRRLYWYLISKGHRTYLYLPLFCRRFFPDRRGEDAELAKIAADCSRFLFADSWKEELGILQFAQSHGQLTPELARSTLERSGHEDIAFFLEKNPGFERGDELVCVTELSPENLRGIAKRYLIDGMQTAGDMHNAAGAAL